MKRKSTVFFAGLLSALLLAGCASTAPAEDQGAAADAPAAPASDTVDIGIIAPTSGSVAVYGVAASNGTKLAFDELNEGGGIGGKQIKYTIYDDKGDSTESVNAYNKLANNDNVIAVVGAVTSGPTATVAQASQGDFMPIITPTGTAEGITAFGDNIFRACFIDSYQALTMATFAKDNLQAKTAAVLYNIADDYSTGLAENFRSTFEAGGGTVVAFEAYISEDTDYKTQLTKIKAESPDVLFLPDYYETIALIAKQANDAGITSTLLGADGWDGLFTVLEDKSLVQGAYYCAHYATDDTDPVIQNFITKFNDVYGQTPNSFAALGYDAGKIIAQAIDTAGSTDSKAIVEALKTIDYNGVTGNIKFDENGNPIKSVSIITIDGGEAKLFEKVTP